MFYSHHEPEREGVILADGDARSGLAFLVDGVSVREGA